MITGGHCRGDGAGSHEGPDNSPFPNLFSKNVYSNSEGVGTGYGIWDIGVCRENWMLCLAWCIMQRVEAGGGGGTV